MTNNQTAQNQILFPKNISLCELFQLALPHHRFFEVIHGALFSSQMFYPSLLKSVKVIYGSTLEGVLLQMVLPWTFITLDLASSWGSLQESINTQKCLLIQVTMGADVTTLVDIAGILQYLDTAKRSEVFVNLALKCQ